VTLTTGTYEVELMPSGNVFSPGDRIRLYILGTPLEQLPSLPGSGRPNF
jgi:predicted acyl esterase